MCAQRFSASMHLRQIKVATRECEDQTFVQARLNWKRFLQPHPTKAAFLAQTSMIHHPSIVRMPSLRIRHEQNNRGAHTFAACELFMASTDQCQSNQRCVSVCMCTLTKLHIPIKRRQHRRSSSCTNLCMVCMRVARLCFAVATSACPGPR